MARRSDSRKLRRDRTRPGTRDARDSDAVRETFRRVVRGAAVLAALVALAHLWFLSAHGQPMWAWCLAFSVLCIPCYSAMGMERAFPVFFVAFLVFVGAIVTSVTVLANMYGRDTAFHLQLLIGFPLIAVSGRIRVSVKIAVAAVLAVGLIAIDHASTEASATAALDARAMVWIRTFNLAVIAFAMTALAYRYFLIVNAQQAELHRHATTDPLTGLLNRRQLTLVAEQSIEASRRHGGAVSLVICDIDHFKSINDRYGHDSGDVVIRIAGETFGRALRATDYVGRWGGEEFLILLPDTDRTSALVLAERMREAIAAEQFDIGAIRIRVTITAGVAVVLDGEAFEDALVRADAALYVGKTLGRNRVVDADPHRASPSVEDP